MVKYKKVVKLLRKFSLFRFTVDHFVVFKKKDAWFYKPVYFLRLVGNHLILWGPIFVDCGFLSEWQQVQGSKVQKFTCTNVLQSCSKNPILRNYCIIYLNVESHIQSIKKIYGFFLYQKLENNVLLLIS